ncbi:MAG: hypothetical protein EXS08_01400 [Planctomycetes bacterium]|nr:hypothetical protein [Planctomycetota bacterium]
MSPSPDSIARPVWILGAGLALVGLGLVAQSQTTNPPPPSPAFMTQGFGTSDSNGGMIAVTGVDVTGGTLLFLVDTVGRHLSVYQAQGGTSSTANLKWIGGRNIDLDLQVDGFNDKSEISYKELARRFSDNGPSATSNER